MNRKRIFEIIEKGQEHDKASKVYDVFLMIAIILSIMPLCFKTQNRAFFLIDQITAAIFIADYLLRLLTADYIFEVRAASSFILYPLRPMAVIDLLSILPSVAHINPAFRALKALRLFRTLRVFKFVRYSKNVMIITDVIKRKKEALLTVSALAVGYVFIMALIVFQIEPQTFDSFFSAFYWSTVSLTTVGYGDIFPVSGVGQFIAMISSFVGIAIVALPSGIITAGYLESVEKHKDV